MFGITLFVVIECVSNGVSDKNEVCVVWLINDSTAHAGHARAHTHTTILVTDTMVFIEYGLKRLQRKGWCVSYLTYCVPQTNIYTFTTIKIIFR